jgi:hypothetical protein
MWIDKLYSVYNQDGYKRLIYYLSIPFLLALYCINIPPACPEPFGYTWLAKEKRDIIQGCEFFDKHLGLCSEKKDFCFILNMGSLKEQTK